MYVKLDQEVTGELPRAHKAILMSRCAIKHKQTSRIFSYCHQFIFQNLLHKVIPDFCCLFQEEDPGCHRNPWPWHDTGSVHVWCPTTPADQVQGPQSDEGIHGPGTYGAVFCMYLPLLLHEGHLCGESTEHELFFTQILVVLLVFQPVL